jgi:hypothetical protein
MEKRKGILILPDKRTGNYHHRFWNPEGSFENVFYTKPFRRYCCSNNTKTPELKEAKLFTHEVQDKSSLIEDGEWVLHIRERQALQELDVKKLLPLKKEGSWYCLRINLSKEDFPVAYNTGYTIHRKNL